MNSARDLPLTSSTHPYCIRSFREEDRSAVSALGSLVVDGWHARGDAHSLHLVATEETTQRMVGHLQVADHSGRKGSRRSGQSDFTLQVEPAYRRRGIGSTLYAEAEAFAIRKGARLMYAACLDEPASSGFAFLSRRDFVPLERFYPSCLDLQAFEPGRFSSAVTQVLEQGIELCKYSELGDSDLNRRRLYDLETAARSGQPFREIGPYVAVPFDKWEEEFTRRDPTAIFLALANARADFVGVVTGLEWYFTGVQVGWTGLGIATALKVLCITEAKDRGLGQMETENHEDNYGMLSINRKLGFVFSTPEQAFIKRLITPAT